MLQSLKNVVSDVFDNLSALPEKNRDQGASLLNEQDELLKSAVVKDYGEIVKLDLLYKKSVEEYRVVIAKMSKQRRMECSIQYVQLAKAYMREETDFESMIVDYEKAYILNPENTAIAYDLGLSYLKQKNNVAAVGVFSTLTKKMRNSSSVFCNLAEAYVGTGDYEKAEDALRSAVRVEKDGDLKQEIGLFAREVRSEKGVVDKFIQQIPAQPRKYELRMGLADIYFKNGRYELFVEQVTEIWKMANINVKYVYKLGIAYAVLNKFGKAEEMLKKTLDAVDKRQKDIKLDEVRVELGRVFELQKKIDEAFEQYQQAIRINPENMTAYYRRGNIYAQKNMYSEAITDYQAGKGLEKLAKYKKELKYA